MGQISGQYNEAQIKKWLPIFFSQLFFVYLSHMIYVLSEYGLISSSVLHIHITS